MFQRLTWQFQLIFGLWTSQKWNLREGKKANFLVVPRHCELIFCLMTSQNVIWLKSNSDDSSWWMTISNHFLLLDQPKMRLYSNRLSDDSSGRMALKSHFLHFEKHKIWLWCVRESDVSSGARHCDLIFFLLTSLKCDLGEVEKAMFHVFACNFEIIFGLLTIPCHMPACHSTQLTASRPAQNATWLK